MRYLLILLALVLGSAFGQDKPNTYGKTDAQILQMGFDAWVDFYTSKAGSSTADMCDAAGIYGEVAGKRNDALLKKRSDRAKLSKLRSLLSDFDTSSIDIAFNESGGGTMYNPMWASVKGETEDLIYKLMTDTGPPAPHRVVSDVTKKLTHLGQLLEEMRKDKSNSYFKYGEAKASLGKMKLSFQQAVSIAKTMPRRDSDLILRFCFERVQNALGEEH